MTRGRAAYADQLRRLLPRGLAWQPRPGTMMARLLDGLAEELARIDGRASVLADEADPLTALELLEDWERVAGLPDACLSTGGTTTERQRRVARKISGLGGQSKSYLIALAAQLGLVVEIEEFAPLAAGFRVGQRCQSPQWRFAFRVRLLPFSESGLTLRAERFRAGASRAGDRLRSFSVSELECVIRRAAPAHAAVMFAYPVDPEPVLWFDFISQGDY